METGKHRITVIIIYENASCYFISKIYFNTERQILTSFGNMPFQISNSTNSGWILSETKLASLSSFTFCSNVLISFTYNTKHYSFYIWLKLPFTNMSAASTIGLKEYPEEIFYTDNPFILAHEKSVFNSLSFIFFVIHLCVNMRCKFPGFFFPLLQNHQSHIFQ
jgi:hypothetical protein